MEFRIEEKKAFEVVGLKRRISSVEGENFTSIPKFWQEVMKDGSFDKIQKNAGDLGTMGLMCNLEGDEGSFDYYIASEGNCIDGLDYDVLRVPDGNYAVFTAIGPLPESIQDVWKNIFSEFFSKTEYKHAGTVELEVYLPGDSSHDDYKSEVWIPIK